MVYVLDFEGYGENEDDRRDATNIWHRDPSEHIVAELTYSFISFLPL
jgi:hypothetical protein